MRLILVALLFAISYAQTVLPPNIQDGSVDHVGICSLVESLCESLANQCVISYCRQANNDCFTQGKEYGTRCETTAIDENAVERTVQGVCVDSICAFTVDNVECDNPVISAERTFISCGNAGFDKTWRFPQGEQCVLVGSECQDFGPVVNNVECTTSQTLNDANHEIFDVHYIDHLGKCIIGDLPECVISTPGVYEYMGMTITWGGVTETADTSDTYLAIPLTTKILSPQFHCPSGFCRGTIECNMWGPEPCGRTIGTCDGTPPPTEEPTFEPTDEPVASAHGDPIIWTFAGECYDLQKDGFYLASSHELFDHQVYIGIYNDYMREIQIRDKYRGNIMFSISNFGELMVDGWPNYYSEHQRICEPGKDEECFLFFKEFIFDAQELEYNVQILGHSYLDPALREGETGIHLDIYPRPFPGFKEEGYTGLYFENPIPFESGVCYDY